MATRAREAGDTVDCSLVHSTNSFSFNALMSCSTESSRTGSKDMVATVNARAPATVCVRQAKDKSLSRRSEFGNLIVTIINRRNQYTVVIRVTGWKNL
jgi:hypothetical protein